MNKNFDQELISSYMDEELDRSQQDAVRDHLTDSAEDEQLLSDFQMMGNLLRELPQEQAPLDTLEQIQDKIRLQESKSIITRPSWNQASRILGWTTVATLMIACGTVLFFQNRDEATSADLGFAGLEPRETVTMTLPAESANELNLLESQTVLERSERSISKSDNGMESNSDIATDHALNWKNGPMAEMDGVGLLRNQIHSDDIAPAPPVPADLSAEALAQLEVSPKFECPVQPGQTLSYVCNNEADEVTVVELSVVDVAKTYGRVQILLTQNTIVTPQAGQGHNPQSQSVAGNNMARRSNNSRPFAATNRSKGVDPQEKVDNLSELSLEVAQQELENNNALMAFYIEASESQLINSLNEMDGLQEVKEIRVGSSTPQPQQVYSVVPLLAGFESELADFDAFDVNSNSNGEEKADKNGIKLYGTPSQPVLAEKTDLAVKNDFGALPQFVTTAPSGKMRGYWDNSASRTRRSIKAHKDDTHKGANAPSARFSIPDPAATKPQSFPMVPAEKMAPQPHILSDQLTTNAVTLEQKSSIEALNGFNAIEHSSLNSYQIPVQLKISTQSQSSPIASADQKEKENQPKLFEPEAAELSAFTDQEQVIAGKANSGSAPPNAPPQDFPRQIRCVVILKEAKE